jgi:hypothetical protein
VVLSMSIMSMMAVINRIGKLELEYLDYLSVEWGRLRTEEAHQDRQRT